MAKHKLLFPGAVSSKSTKVNLSGKPKKRTLSLKYQFTVYDKKGKALGVVTKYNDATGQFSTKPTGSKVQIQFARDDADIRKRFENIQRMNRARSKMRRTLQIIREKLLLATVPESELEETEIEIYLPSTDLKTAPKIIAATHDFMRALGYSDTITGIYPSRPVARNVTRSYEPA